MFIKTTDGSYINTLHIASITKSADGTIKARMANVGMSYDLDLSGVSLTGEDKKLDKLIDTINDEAAYRWKEDR